MPLEKPVLPLPRRPWSDFGPLYFSNAVVAFLFSATGPIAIILSVGSRGGLSEADIASWIFAAFLINAPIGDRVLADLPAAAGVPVDASRARCWSGRRSPT